MSDRGGGESSMRDGGTSLTIRNSGLEVWLYDVSATLRCRPR